MQWVSLRYPQGAKKDQYGRAAHQWAIVMANGDLERKVQRARQDLGLVTPCTGRRQTILES
jgi:hypothetical protein